MGFGGKFGELSAAANAAGPVAVGCAYTTGSSISGTAIVSSAINSTAFGIQPGASVSSGEPTCERGAPTDHMPLLPGCVACHRAILRSLW